MLISIAWRNLSRNLRRSILVGSAVTFGMLLAFWLLGIKHGGFVQMIDQAVENGLGHYQVLGEGYLDRTEPRIVVNDAPEVMEILRGLDHVEGVTARAVSEGMVSRDNESAQVKVVGVDAETEGSVSAVPSELFQGEVAVEWCLDEMAEAQEVMGGDRELFERWCGAMSNSEYLSQDEERGLVLGADLAKSLLVSVGDEVTLQVVRAVAGDGMEQGEVSRRRLVVTGLVRVGNPEVDEMTAYIHRETLSDMLGTSGPNEVVVLLDDIDNLDAAAANARESLAGREGIAVYTWSERNPALHSLIEAGAGANDGVYFILFLLIALGVFNAVYMSVLERTKEFGVMLSLGMRRLRLLSLVMTEVGLLGMVSVGLGTVLGVAMELFGRSHGWPMEWFGYEDMEGTQVAGVTYDTIYYSALSPEKGVAIVITMMVMFLLAGVVPAIRASRLAPVEAMRVK